MLQPWPAVPVPHGIEVLHAADAQTALQKRFGACTGGAGYGHLAQEYIEPLLVDGRKFDLRAYLLVPSTNPVTWWFNRGHLRLSLTQFDAGSGEKNVHLTNFHQQILIGKNESDARVASRMMWTYRAFAIYLRDHEICESDIFREGARATDQKDGRLPPCAFERQLERAFAIIARAVGLHSSTHRRIGAYAMLGVDFMLSKDAQLFFLESNSAPGISGHSIRWKQEMGEDLFVGALELTRILNEKPQRFHTREGEKHWGKGAARGNWWQLVFSEQEEKCRRAAGLDPFDPCAAAAA